MSGRRRVQFSGDDSDGIDDDILNDILADSPVNRRKPPRGPPKPPPPTEPEQTTPEAAGGSPEKPLAASVNNKKKLMQELFLGIKDAKTADLSFPPSPVKETTDNKSLPQSPSSSLISQPRTDKVSSPPSSSLRLPLASPVAASVHKTKTGIASKLDFDDDDSDILGKLEPRPKRVAASGGSKLMDDIFGRKSDKEGSSSVGFLDSLLAGDNTKPKTGDGDREFQLDARYKQAAGGGGAEKQMVATAETSGGGIQQQRRRRGQPTVGGGMDTLQLTDPQPAGGNEDNPFPWMAKES